jgi:hypothetical protein
MNSGWVLLLAFLPVTTQLSLRSDEPDVDADGTVDDPVYDFGGFFEFVGRAFEEGQQQLVQVGRKTAETLDEAGPYKALLAPGAPYPGSDAWPVGGQGQCTEEDTKVHLDIAFKRAKKRLSPTLYANDFKTGECYKNATLGTGWNMEKFKTCYQVYFNVTTPCAQCIGSVFNMATYNMSTSCYSLCKGRPHKRDGTHWCWEDCQSCMYYIGKKMTECYGEPYDMQCRYAKEMNREQWFEKNGINPNTR